MPDFFVIKLKPDAGRAARESLPSGSTAPPPGCVAADWEPVAIVLDAESEAAAVETASYGCEGEPAFKALPWSDDLEYHLHRPPPEIAEHSEPRLRTAESPTDDAAK